MATIGRTINLRLMIQWDLLNWTDESAYLVRASGDRKVAAPGTSILSPRGTISGMSVTLRNPDGRFSPLRTDGALYSHIGNGESYHTPISMQVSVDGGGYTRVFFGLLKNPSEVGSTYSKNPTVTFQCRGMEERITQKRISTTLANFASYYDSIKTESEIMEAWLIAAGLSAGDYDLDDGLQTIPAAWLDEDSPLDDCWQLAAASGGWFFSDRDGVLNYKNATYLASGAAATASYTTGDFTQLTLRYDDKELYSEITVEAAPRDMQPTGVLWEPDEVPVIKANDSKTIIAQMRQPAYSIDSVAYNAVTAGGEDIGADVSVEQTQYAQRIEFVITNANATYACYMRNMQIVGQSVGGAASMEEKAVSVDSFWDATYREKASRRLRGNVYIQSAQQAAMLAEMLRDWHETPRLFIGLAKVQGDPTRELLDRITVTDANTMSSSVDVFVTGIRWDADLGGFWQTLDGIAAEGFYPYADDADGYFILGASGSNIGTGAGSAYLFY